MSFKPITEEKFNEMVGQGFSPDQIIQFEQRRKAEEITNSQKGVGGIGGFALGALKSTASYLQNAGGLVTKPLSSLTGMEDITGFSEKQLERKGAAEKFGGFASDVAQFAIPAMKISKLGNLTKMGSMALFGTRVATSGAVGAIQSGDVKGGIAPAVVESVFPVVSKIVGPFAKKIPGKIAQKMEEINLRLSPTQKQQITKAQPEILEYMTKNKVTGTPQVRYEKMQTVVDGFESKIQKLLQGATYNKQEVINSIKDLPELFLEKAQNPQVYNNMVKEVDSLIKLIQKRKGDTVPATIVNQFKRSYAKNARNKAGDTVKNDAREAISDGLYTMLQNDFNALQAINKEYAKALTSLKIIGKSIGKNELGLIGNMIAMFAGGGVGSAVAGPIGTAVGGAVGPQVAKTVAGTQSRSQIGAGMQRLSEYLGRAKTTSNGDFIIPKSIIQSLMN